MSELMTLPPTCPEIIPPSDMATPASHSPPKQVLGLAKLIDAKTLSTTCSMLAGMSTDNGVNQGQEASYDQAKIKEQCNQFCRSLRRGYGCSMKSYGLEPQFLMDVVNPLPRLILQAATTLLVQPVRRFVASVLPDTFMWPGRSGTWNMWAAMDHTADVLGWSHVATLQFKRTPRQFRFADVMMDFHQYLSDHGELRLLALGLAEPGSRDGETVLSSTSPLTSSAIELRLHRMLSGCETLENQSQAVMLRQDDRVIVIGASVNSVMSQLDRVKETLREAGLSVTDANYCVDLREGGIAYRGLLLDRLTGQARFRLDASAYKDLESRLKLCHDHSDPGRATQRALAEWAYEFAPGLIDRNAGPTEWDRAEAIRKNILTAFRNVGFEWTNADQTIDQLSGSVSRLWWQFHSWQPVSSWIGRHMNCTATPVTHLQSLLV